MEEQTQTSEAQTLYGQQTPRETGKQGVMALRMNEDGLLFFKPGDRLFLKRHRSLVSLDSCYKSPQQL
jgi:hypothetical protein